MNAKYIAMFRNNHSNETKPDRASPKEQAVAVIGELNVDLVASGLASKPVCLAKSSDLVCG
jgi:hypothetical protein